MPDVDQHGVVKQTVTPGSGRRGDRFSVEIPPNVHAPGDLIAGRYRLISMLGEGGMGCVWRAHATSLDVDVAVKLIRPGVTSEAAATRLLQEARAAARIGHPSIVRMMDCGETDDGEAYLAMELLPGESLAALIDRKGRLTPERAVRTLLPIASALTAAHAKGILHRDLKPDNIVIVPDGASMVPRLVDFGIAKLLATDGDDHDITQRGTIVGSPEYMSPEQGAGLNDVDQRADVWALAILIYESLTGDVPFRGATSMAILAAVALGKPATPESLGVDDEGLWPLIARGLEKEREARWPDMKTFGLVLARWALERGIETDAAGTSISAHWFANHPISDVDLANASSRAAELRKKLQESAPPPPAASPAPHVASADTSVSARLPGSIAPPDAKVPPLPSVKPPAPLVVAEPAPAFAPRTFRRGEKGERMTIVLVVAILALVAIGTLFFLRSP